MTLNSTKVKCSNPGGCDRRAEYRVFFIGCHSGECDGHPNCAEHAAGAEVRIREDWADW